MQIRSSTKDPIEESATIPQISMPREYVYLRSHKKMLRKRKQLVGSTIKKFEVEGPPTTTKSEQDTTKPEKYTTIFADRQKGFSNGLIHKMATETTQSKIQCTNTNKIQHRRCNKHAK